MRLNELRPAKGARKKEKRIGRGPGSGHGKTSTKGHKGQLARAGGGKAPGFEGGQMPLIRRIPKRGFHNIFRIEYTVVNLKMLTRFEGQENITPQRLREAGLVKSRNARIKILGEGELTRPLVIQAHRFSQSAIVKIQKAGGKAEVLT
ncbi:MAG TPA: 50S ribosomal protein L15 [Syntrophales bacterium]|nr:50S ribosomal protein L15 [Syntrophales bacterium]